MYFANLIEQFIGLLNSLDYEGDVKVIAAFPFAYKPTLLDKIIVTVAPYGIDVENIELGEAKVYGDVSIQISVFVPQDMGSPCMVNTLDTILGCLTGLKPSRITINSIQQWDNLSCFCANCIFTYKSEI